MNILTIWYHARVFNYINPIQHDQLWMVLSINLGLTQLSINLTVNKFILQMISVQNPCWLMFIQGYTIQYIVARGIIKIYSDNPILIQPISITGRQRVLNTAQVNTKSFYMYLVSTSNDHQCSKTWVKSTNLVRLTITIVDHELQ